MRCVASGRNRPSSTVRSATSSTTVEPISKSSKTRSARARGGAKPPRLLRLRSPLLRRRRPPRSAASVPQRQAPHHSRGRRTAAEALRSRDGDAATAKSFFDAACKARPRRHHRKARRPPVPVRAIQRLDQGQMRARQEFVIVGSHRRKASAERRRCARARISRAARSSITPAKVGTGFSKRRYAISLQRLAPLETPDRPAVVIRRACVPRAG